MTRNRDNLASYRGRTIRWKDVREKRRQGYKVGVLHLHSSFSRDVPNLESNHPDRLISKGIREGADFIAITDHDNDLAWRNAGRRPACWIRAVEMEIFDRKSIGHPVHFGLLNIRDDALSDELHKIAAHYHDANLLVHTALENGATVIANHPWWGPGGYNINSVRYWDFIQNYNLPVELNDKRSIVENIATLAYAARRGLPVVATTDSHTRKVLPTCTLARGKTVDEFLANVRAGDTYVVPGHAGFIHVPAMMARYVLDVIQSPLPKEFYRVPLKLNSVPMVDRIVEEISCGSVTSRILQKRASALFAVPVTYLVCAFLYIPTTYLSASMKVLRDLRLRAVMEPAVPELLPE